jgi:hypothetical protein
MGSSVKLMNRLTSTEATTVRPKGRNHSPDTPGMKATGTNTATMENVVAATARPISAVPLIGRGAAVGAALHVAHDVLAHDDGVVDQHADGQRQAQQAHEVEREAAQPHGDERRDHRGGQATAR